MPWPKDHKSRTREQIVRGAAAAFRARGVSGVGVADIMARARLTHGGFYAHFSSKEDLLAAALEHASGETIDALSKALEAIPVERRLQAVIDAYLSTEHAAHPERGCPVAALGSELVRTDGGRRQMARSVKRRLDWLRSLMPSQPRRGLREEQLVGVLACMVGGLILARVVGAKDSAALLKTCREFLDRAVGAATPVAERRRRPARRRLRRK